MACAHCIPIVKPKRVEPDNQPCPARCRRCSRCIRSVSFWSRGGRDYLGTQGEARLAGQASAS